MKVYNNIKTVLRWVILAFIIYQAASSTAGMWIALTIGFYTEKAVAGGGHYTDHEDGAE